MNEANEAKNLEEDNGLNILPPGAPKANKNRELQPLKPAWEVGLAIEHESQHREIGVAVEHEDPDVPCRPSWRIKHQRPRGLAHEQDQYAVPDDELQDDPVLQRRARSSGRQVARGLVPGAQYAGMHIARELASGAHSSGMQVARELVPGGLEERDRFVRLDDIDIWEAKPDEPIPGVHSSSSIWLPMPDEIIEDLQETGRVADIAVNDDEGFDRLSFLVDHAASMNSKFKDDDFVEAPDDSTVASACGTSLMREDSLRRSPVRRSPCASDYTMALSPSPASESSLAMLIDACAVDRSYVDCGVEQPQSSNMALTEVIRGSTLLLAHTDPANPFTEVEVPFQVHIADDALSETPRR